MIAAVQQQAVPAADWLERCRAGDQAAWRRLYQENLPMVFRLAIRMGASEREAADVAQEVFVRVWRGLGSFRGDSQLRTWLYRITMNEVLRLRRGAAMRRAWDGVLEAFGREAAAPTPLPRPDRVVEQAEAFAELQVVLARMKPKQRAVLVLAEIEELSAEEIARIVRAPIETVHSRLRFARADFDRLCRQRAALRPDGNGGAR